MPRQIKRFGYIPDLPDQRDRRLSFTREAIAALPPSASVRSLMPAVYDQGPIGSCVGNACARAMQFERRKQGLSPDFIPSRLFIYWNARAREGTQGWDSGCSIRDGMKTLASQGACPESEWRYIPGNFAWKPYPDRYASASRYRAIQYSRIGQDETQLKACIAANYPFVFGFSVYESFMQDEVANTGKVPMPAVSEAVIGGHAVTAVGYDDALQRFDVCNSWGADWGDKGYFSMPYAFLTDPDLSSDFWTLRLESA